MDVVRLQETGLVRLQFHVDVQDAMGANLVNSVAEAIRPVAEQISGGQCLMAILSNASDGRIVTAAFTMPVERLSRGGFTGEQVAKRIVAASDLAQEDDSRAVTHNKGIMNGITALALATGNDTRALEAGMHRFASRTGKYRGLSRFALRNGNLEGTLVAPIAMGTLGGAMGIHPASRLALRLLGDPTATELSRIAAAVGLGQNLAALFALVSEGIQHGHMGLHANRLAWIAGARGEERSAVVEGLRESGIYNGDEAKRILSLIRDGVGRDSGAST
ncbi:MAG: hypothetical protein E4H09_03135 [Spirochaetales bacterium]|nr:MAG: hypothetical protein E4H09_03135 [Spirochaetales bacterium]